MSTHAVWYFDVISPFAYLQWQRIKAIRDCTFELRPILFAGLLGLHGHKGPAEIPAKRLFSYRHVQWRAARDGIAFAFPPAHPFSPVTALRLCVAAGATPEAVDTVFDFIWREGRLPDTPERIAELGARLGLADPAAALEDTGVRATLQHNFDRAVADGLFGVPTVLVDGQLFWGEDATDMLLDYLRDRTLFDTPEMRRLEHLPVGAVRKPAG
jgi:2-hydroxychromene-2-carboxylate isomerase